MSSPVPLRRPRATAVAAGIALSGLVMSAEALAQGAPPPGAPPPGAAPGAPPPGAPPADAPPPDDAPPDEVAPDAPPAADKENKKNGVYADLGLGVLGLAYERVFGDSFALNIAAHYYRPWYVSDHVFGFGGELRGYFFLTDPAPEGFFLSPGLRIDYARAEVDPEDLGPDRVGQDTTFEGYAWGTKFTVGYSVVVADILSIRLGLGVQSHHADLTAGPGEPDFGGAYPAVDFLAGAVF